MTPADPRDFHDLSLVLAPADDVEPACWCAQSETCAGLCDEPEVRDDAPSESLVGRETPRSSECSDPFCAEHSPLMNAPVRFWSCPVDEHRDRRGVVTVEWRQGVAHCTATDCERTSRG